MSVSESYEQALLAFLVVFLIIGAIMLLFIGIYVIGLWKLFKKAGIPGWHALIPGVSQWQLFKVSGLDPRLSLMVILPQVIQTAISKAHGADAFTNSIESAMSPMYWISGILLLVPLAAWIILSKPANQSFDGQGGLGSCIAFVLFQPIWVIVKGFGSAKYTGTHF